MRLFSPVVRSALDAPARPDVRAARHTFAAIGSDYATWQALVGGVSTTRVSRKLAEQIPAVVRAATLLATPSTLPLHARNAAGADVPTQLLAQPESLKGLTRSVTISNTFHDLFYEASAMWTVVQRDAAGFPSCVDHLAHGTWSVDAAGTIWIGGREADAADCILFTSPLPAFCVVGASTVRALVQLAETSAMYVSQPNALEYFTSDADPSDEEVQDFLGAWAKARRARSSAYLPDGVQRHGVDQLTAEELELIGARNFGVLEVCRLTGLDPEDMGVPQTSRTYQNATDRKRALVELTFAPYIAAVEQRLSLNDCVPRGQSVRFGMDGFLRANTTERYASYTAALTGGWLTLAEVRDLENRPPLPEAAPADEPDETSSEDTTDA